MFSRVKNSVETKVFNNDRRPASPSVISSDLTITGDLVSEGELHIDGRVDGDIRCRVLIVGVNAQISGAIQVDVARVHGEINGQLFAKSVFLACSAKVTGDITHERLEIEPGAFLEGNCRHMDDPIPAEQAPADLMLTDARKSEK
ncbi:MAG: polymer-forming cytoskeletal protein [Alphaproteobacteria bacterium]|nr:polymer-forming cytoskeletal protein [Alphaproteobacteria bacterium]